MLVILLTSLLSGQLPAPPCTGWKVCRDLALQAAASQDYETFHDLAWRAMQTRHANDPALMYTLARAQSLSGRPHDALVMLGRLADMGIATDADTNPDFARVRSLSGWPELAARLEHLRTGNEPPRGESPSSTGQEPRRTPVDEVARFKAPQFSPGGIAYDAVSRRYLVGNFPDRKLTEIEEGSNRAATLAGVAAQFFEVKALEIDPRQGDLWVISDGASDKGLARSALHKLQLVSGRVLKVFEPAPADLPARFVDVAVAASGAVLVLDGATPRVFTTAAAPTLRRLMILPDGSPASIAPVHGRHAAYVAYADRLLRVDFEPQAWTPVTTAQGQLAGLDRIRWYRDSLVGVQSLRDGHRRVIRVPLTSKAHAAAPEVLDEWRDASPGPPAAALIGDDFFYLVPGETEAVIRRLRLR